MSKRRSGTSGAGLVEMEKLAAAAVLKWESAGLF
jgi:hypothetical protein